MKTTVLTEKPGVTSHMTMPGHGRIAGTKTASRESATDLKEERDVAAYNSWVVEPVVNIVGEFEESLRKYPPIKLGTPDPYTPPK